MQQLVDIELPLPSRLRHSFKLLTKYSTDDKTKIKYWNSTITRQMKDT